MNNSIVNLSAVLQTGQGNVTVYKNATPIYSGFSPSNNLTLFNALGFYNITAFFHGNSNYTAAYETWW